MSFSIKKFLPRTLFGRSLMILVIPVILIQVVTSIVFFDRHWTKMTDRLAFAVAGEISVISDQFEKVTDPEEIKEVASYAAQSLDLLVSFEPDGSLEVERENISDFASRSFVAKTLARALNNQVRRPHAINLDIEEKWVEALIELDNGLLRVSMPQRRLFSSSGYIFLLWVTMISIVLLTIAILFMRNQIRPIRRLAIVAERFGRGLEVSPGFKPEGSREVRQAAQAFIDMQGRIRRQIQQRTTMLAGVSHDLRTPLTRMKLQAAMMPSTPDNDALKQDISDMERMIDAYLDFARGEGGEKSARENIGGIIERLVNGFKRQSVKVHLDIDAGSELMAHIRPLALERCFSNIMNNARKYAEEIWVKAWREDDTVMVQIDDNGPGIDEDKLDDVFKPFYRVEGSRNPSTGGVGLGLPIAQDIVFSHGGKIDLSRSEQGGLSVLIKIPV